MNVQLEIFSYLDWEDILSVRLVSRRWRELADFQFEEKGKIVCDASWNLDVVGILHRLWSWHVVPRSLVFKNVALNRAVSREGEEVMERLREMALVSCAIQPDALVRLLGACSKLKRLCLDEPGVSFLCLLLKLMPGSLPSVTRLELRSTRRLDDSLLSVFWQACPNLMEFSLSSSNFTPNPAIFNSFYSKGSEEPSRYVLTMGHLECLLRSKERFRSLALTQMNLDSSLLVNILCESSIDLCFLDLSGCKEVSSGCLTEIVEKQKSLPELRLVETSGVDDAVLSKICNLTFLEELWIGDVSVSFSKDVLEGLNRLWDLKNLHVPCYGELCLGNREQLKFLSLEYCRLTPNLEQICEPQQLRELCLEHCFSVTDSDMRMLLDSLVNLVVLRLEDLPLTDFAFFCSANSSCTGLGGITFSALKLKLREFLEASVKSVAERRFVREMKAHVTSEELLLSACSDLDSPLRKLKRLKELVLKKMKNVSDVNVILGIRDQGLTHLDISLSPLLRLQSGTTSSPKKFAKNSGGYYSLAHSENQDSTTMYLTDNRC
ncbi:unnamed protein product [Darwinula stevensoni]|uniref:F-box domain-containing protein n=1 Tax=Darwinula stevensoni TaxID=69355 RepID=A0A7R8X5S9_9CRUS|nr:unnamed protein product [Darwinula stevensoni]CAG0886249.1 unnamed protein product [Darwinula stevensoni]